MRLLIDQDDYGVTIRHLVSLGHDIELAVGLGLARAADRELLAAAHEGSRIMVTRDRDFGALVFVGERRAGVI